MKTKLTFDARVRRAITNSVKKCPKTREQVAEEMQRSTGKKVTLRMLNAYTGEANELHRFPAEWIPAFCSSTRTFALLRLIANACGFHLITERDLKALKIGKAVLALEEAKRAAGVLEPQR